MNQTEEHAMKHCLLVAVLALGFAGCGSSTVPKPPATSDASAEPDTGAPADARVTVDVSAPDTQTAPPDVGRTADSGGAPADAGADTAAPVDTGRSDLAADTRPDSGGDSASAPGATCGPGASRDMLCTTYCDGVARVCTGANALFRGAEECRAACTGPASSWACGNPGETTGNSLFCRLTHLTLAGVGSAAQECPNAGPSSPACQ
jgi:hypothetical protein